MKTKETTYLKYRNLLDIDELLLYRKLFENKVDEIKKLILEDCIEEKDFWEFLIDRIDYVNKRVGK